MEAVKQGSAVVGMKNATHAVVAAVKVSPLCSPFRCCVNNNVFSREFLRSLLRIRRSSLPLMNTVASVSQDLQRMLVPSSQLNWIYCIRGPPPRFSPRCACRLQTGLNLELRIWLILNGDICLVELVQTTGSEEANQGTVVSYTHPFREKNRNKSTICF